MKKEYWNSGGPDVRKSATMKDILERQMLFDDFVEQFEQMTEDELQEFDMIYSMTHYRFGFASKLNLMWQQDKFANGKKYCLIKKSSQEKWTLSEGRLVQVPASFVTNTLTKTFIKQHKPEELYAPKWCKAITGAGQMCVEEIIKFFPLSPHQIGIEPCPDYRINKIWVAIPDVEDNLTLLEKAMSFFGYSLLKKQSHEYRSKLYDTEWLMLVFAPDFQEYVDDYVYEENNYFYHLSPQKYEKKILRQGLCPRAINNTYHYPARIYMLREIATSPSGQEYKLTDTRILELSRELAESRLLFDKNEFVDEHLYTIYRIKTSDIPERINFSYDMDYYPLGIFTTDNISPDVLEVVGHFDSRE